MIELDKVYNEDCLQTLARMDDNSIDCIVTSPPYYGLRKYSESELEIGREESPYKYIDNLVKVFTEAYRVLKPTGTLWLNLGDSDCGTGDKGDYSDPKDGNRNGQSVSITRKVEGLKRKDLIGIPWMAAFALRERCGFYLRQDIIWAKGNALPESVKDRCVKSHEYIFLLAKSEKYYFDFEAIQEPAVTSENRPFGIQRERLFDYDTKQAKNPKAYLKDSKNLHRNGQTVNSMHQNRAEGGKDVIYAVRNKRDVWTVNTQPSDIEHCAMFPEKLIYPCILAGCPEGGVVYDCFGGSGTTAITTIHCGGNRHWILSELSTKYAEIAQKRIDIEQSQLTLF
jgi:DNA modification methylase